MFELQSLQSYPETRLASVDSKRATSAEHSPRQNHILAALPPADYQRLLPYLEPVALPLGWTLQGAGERATHMYFLTEGVVSRIYMTESGATTELAITGSEGVIGVALFLGGGSAPSQAVVVSPGYAYRLRPGLLKSELDHESPLMHLLLRYTQALIAQIGHVALCNRHHSLQQQLCRWILSCLDRLPSNELAMTHELIANMLGVRREGVTEAAGKLQKAGLIHCGRGHISVLDRPRLAALACECYAAVNREYDDLLYPQSTNGNAREHRTCRQ
jgi:CRP-like cAMP-binding protein